jgi:hypothetical protein
VDEAEVDGSMTDVQVEHAILYSGGSMLVRPNDPGVEAVWPLADWIRAHRRNGGRVYRRRVVVVEDWQEMGDG